MGSETDGIKTAAATQNACVPVDVRLPTTWLGCLRLAPEALEHWNTPQKSGTHSTPSYSSLDAANTHTHTSRSESRATCYLSLPLHLPLSCDVYYVRAESWLLHLYKRDPSAAIFQGRVCISHRGGQSAAENAGTNLIIKKIIEHRNCAKKVLRGSVCGVRHHHHHHSCCNGLAVFSALQITVRANQLSLFVNSLQMRRVQQRRW